MSEYDSVQKTPIPNTVPSLVDDFIALGIRAGMTLLVHSSLSSLGWVNGGPVAVILALEEVLGPGGTLVMPTHSSGNSDPAQWQNPPVPEAWWQTIRDTMPAYDPDMTPTRGMGAIPECFRKQRGVLRSSHPQLSFAARGPNAPFITQNHRLEYALGEGSPLARLYELDAWVLLLGVGHANNTSLHLAEYRAQWPGKTVTSQSCALLVEGRRQWVTFPDLPLDSTDFDQIGEAFNQVGRVRRNHVGQAEALLFRQRALVDFAVQWMCNHRT